VLGGMFPRMWLYFFGYSFIELMNPEAGNSMNNYNRFAQIYKWTETNESTVKNLPRLRQVVYEELGLNHLLNKVVEHGSVPSSQIQSLLPYLFWTFYEWSWYASDFLYWLIYFGAYIQENGLLGRDIGMENLVANRKKGYFLSDILYFLVKIFDDVGLYIVLTLKRTPIWSILDGLNECLKNFKFYRGFKLFVNFRNLFRLIGFMCVIGGCSKFCINFSWFFHLVHEIVTNEDNFRAQYA
jgi:hypothetical protein